MPERKPPIYLLTGLILGLVIGVVYTWLFSPQEALETTPAMLRNDFKDTYRELIARAYLYNNDLGRAQTRLALLEDEDPVRALAVQAQLALGDESNNRPARALGLLAAAINAENEGTPIANVDETPIPETQAADAPAGEEPATTEGSATQRGSEPADTPTPPEQLVPTEVGGEDLTLTPSVTPTATATPTATPGPPFILNDMQLECNPGIDPPEIQIYVFDAAGNPVAGVAALVFWEGNVDRFVTGLKPSFGLGYADFEMDPTKTYTLRLENGGDPIQSITGRLCEDNGDSYYGSWRFNFIQP
jgi:hypothetical protein